MGEAEISGNAIVIASHIITYGNAASAEVTELIRQEIEAMWNEPEATIRINDNDYKVRFHITAICIPDLSDIEVISNTNPRNNFFRIEEYAQGNISFVDGLGCNTGYFKLENLYKGSTTAAHEYGHTLGLPHPDNLDYRGKGVPGIMYPRGTLVDPHFQYDPLKPAGVPGGTMHPVYRRVRTKDIEDLGLSRLIFRKPAIVGDFSNVWHPDHALWKSGPG